MNTSLPPNPNDGAEYCEATLKTLYLAGGCFWGVEAYMRRIPGVARTECGYANGSSSNPTYEQLCAGGTGHTETVRVDFSPERASAADILAAFSEIADLYGSYPPGGQYRNGVYWDDSALGDSATSFFKGYNAASGKAVTVELAPLECFYPAEEYHQDYLEKNPDGFCHVDLSMLAKRGG